MKYKGKGTLEITFTPRFLFSFVYTHYVIISILATCGLDKGSSDVKANVECEDVSVRHSVKTYKLAECTVEITDGQLTAAFADSLSRLGAIIIRKAPSTR